MAIPGLKFSVTGAPGGMTRGSTGSRIKEPACVADEADVEFVMETCDLDGDGVITRNEVMPMISRWGQIALSKAGLLTAQ